MIISFQLVKYTSNVISKKSKCSLKYSTLSNLFMNKLGMGPASLQFQNCLYSQVGLTSETLGDVMNR